MSTCSGSELRGKGTLRSTVFSQMVLLPTVAKDRGPLAPVLPAAPHDKERRPCQPCFLLQDPLASSDELASSTIRASAYDLNHDETSSYDVPLKVRS